jgi:putative tricarboxylic transport membrane protein
MRRAFSRNGVAGLVCLAVSLWLLLLTRGLPPAIMVPIGPAFYPRLVLSFMALLSVILIGLDLAAARRRAAAAVAAPPAAETRPNYLLVLATFVVFGLYVAALPALGFRIATFLFVGALQITLDRPRSWKRWLLVVSVAAAVTVICQLTFEDYLSVLLPRGRWSGL